MVTFTLAFVSVGWAVGEPHPVVRPLVTRYIGYAQDDVTLAVHRGLPSRYVTLVISLAAPVRMAGHRLQALVGGLHTSAVLIEQDRTQEGLQLELDPLGVRTLLGVTAAELSGAVVDLAEFGLGDLPERLRERPTWPERFALLDDVLAARAVDPHAAAARAGGGVAPDARRRRPGARRGPRRGGRLEPHGTWASASGRSWGWHRSRRRACCGSSGPGGCCVAATPTWPRSPSNAASTTRRT